MYLLLWLIKVYIHGKNYWRLSLIVLYLTNIKTSFAEPPIIPLDLLCRCKWYRISDRILKCTIKGEFRYIGALLEFPPCLSYIGINKTKSLKWYISEILNVLTIYIQYVGTKFLYRILKKHDFCQDWLKSVLMTFGFGHFGQHVSLVKAFTFIHNYMFSTVSICSILINGINKAHFNNRIFNK